MATNPKKPARVGRLSPYGKVLFDPELAERIRTGGGFSLEGRGRYDCQMRYLAWPAFVADRDAAHAAVLEGELAFNRGDITAIKLDHIRREFEQASSRLNACRPDANSGVLVDSCPDQTLRDRWTALMARKKTINIRRHEPQQQLVDLDFRLGVLRNRLSILKDQQEAASGAEALEYFKQEIAIREREIHRLEIEQATAQGDFDALDQQAFDFQAERAALIHEMALVDFEEWEPAK